MLSEETTRSRLRYVIPNQVSIKRLFESKLHRYYGNQLKLHNKLEAKTISIRPNQLFSR